MWPPALLIHFHQLFLMCLMDVTSYSVHFPILKQNGCVLTCMEIHLKRKKMQIAEFNRPNFSNSCTNEHRNQHLLAHVFQKKG